MDDTTKNMLFAVIPNKKNAKTGNVASGIGIFKKSEYISFIVFLPLKYLIQASSYNIMKTNPNINNNEK